ncbi:hypothetical protein AA313_de0204257 [Arthrobotrys entomopaga]|nr:hypothetical protein AA313_de0204257 [Arthrobotrys entomopaga]
MDAANDTPDATTIITNAPENENGNIPVTPIPPIVEQKVKVETEEAPIDYNSWDAAIVSAITSLPPENLKTRSQQFLSAHPTALREFRTALSTSTLPLPLAPFQLHPTYLLRYLLAEWRDEELKEHRTNLPTIISHSLPRIIASQTWRKGEQDECWSRFGYSNMDDMYTNFTTPADTETFINTWFFQGFFGIDKTGHPVHYELLPDTYHPEKMDTLIIRRILNNEKTLRERIPKLNPPPHLATFEQLSNPKLGVTWVLDARKISMWVVPAVYKTMTGMISYSNKYSSAHYPEQGFRAFVVNLGSVLVSLYHVAIKIMPAQTQRTTSCHGGREVLDEVIGEDGVPDLFKRGVNGKGSGKGCGLSEEERKVQVEGGDVAPWVRVEA